jgi:TonB dependent receptor/CarboxypepD_reg-like domain
MMKKLTYLIGFLLFASATYAQQTIKGYVIDAETKLPLSNVFVKVEDTKLATVTNDKGQFRLSKVKKGRKVLSFELKDHQTLQKEVVSDEAKVTLGIVSLGKPEINTASNANDDIQTITLDDIDGSSDNTGDQNVATQLGGARDLFRQYTRFAWGSVRYRTRGYISNYTENYFNGIPFDDLDDERASFGAYSGLNDVTRLNQSYQGLEPNSFAFGDLAGSSNVDTRAIVQRKGTKLSYTNANRNYSHRMMATYNTGLMSNGWAVSASASHRWAQEGYVPGTFMDSYAFFTSVDKVINPKHSFNFTVFGAPNKQGGAAASVQEMFDLSGSCYYNHDWGYQNGKKRNAVVTNRFSPTAILRHDFKISPTSSLTTAASFQLENNGRTNVNYFNARNPNPDYYSVLPSGTDDLFQRAQITSIFQNNEAARQIDWNYYYQTNYNSIETIKNANGIAGNNVTGKRAKYLLGNDRQDSREANIYSNYQKDFGEHAQFAGGVAVRYFQGHDYRLISDLLGADFSVDVDAFAERENKGGTFSQNDIRYLNRIVKVGDTTGYNYKTNVRNAYAWGQMSWSYNKFDFFLSAKGSATEFWRTGLTQNGRFPDNSLGDSEKRSFLNYGSKAGVTYKLNGRNYFSVYAGYLTKAPNSRDSYLSPRTRNEFAPDLKSEKITSAEAHYHYRSPYFSAQLTGYYTYFKDKVRAFSFFSDEDRSFVNYVAQGLDLRHVGIEAAAEAKITSSITAFAAGTIGQHLYFSRPTSIATPDNGLTSVQSNLNGKTIYIKEYFVANTPQTAITAGIKYNAKRHWFLNVNANYFARRYMDINFNRRTDYAVTAPFGEKTITPGSQLWNNIIAQQKLPDVFVVNALAGKSIKINKYFINCTVGVDNILNAKYISTAFEQWRFDNVKKDINKFPPRYYYAMGINYFAMVALSF